MSKKGKLIRYGDITQTNILKLNNDKELINDNAVMKRCFINTEKLSHAELKLKLHNKLLQLRRNPTETIKTKKVSKVTKKLKKNVNNVQTILPIKNHESSSKNDIKNDIENVDDIKPFKAG
jgi:hypothetical protein